MKLSRFILFASLLFAGALSALAQPCTRHTEAQGGFSICIPDGWAAKAQQGEGFQMLYGQPADGFTPNLNFKEEMSNLELSDYVAAGVKNILASKEKIGATSIDVQGQSDFLTDAGLRGSRVVFLSEYKGHWVRTIQYLFASSPGRKLIVTGTGLEKNKEVFDHVFDRAVKSFRVN